MTIEFHISSIKYLLKWFSMNTKLLKSKNIILLAHAISLLLAACQPAAPTALPTHPPITESPYAEPAGKPDLPGDSPKESPTLSLDEPGHLASDAVLLKLAY